MSELHAALALESFAELDSHLEIRDGIARRYREQLAGIPGLRFQRLEPGDTSTWKDCTIALDPTGFGLSRDVLVAALRADGIDTRCYFDPPVHRQRSHAGESDRPLPVTDRVASEVVSLPIYRDLGAADVDRVAGAIAAVHEHASVVRGVAVG
jgi:dTDP-4-amino-4,6-dideoxygalactose transaminase